MKCRPQCNVSSTMSISDRAVNKQSIELTSEIQFYRSILPLQHPFYLLSPISLCVYCGCFIVVMVGCSCAIIVIFLPTPPPKRGGSLSYGQLVHILCMYMYACTYHEREGTIHLHDPTTFAELRHRVHVLFLLYQIHAITKTRQSNVLLCAHFSS